MQKKYILLISAIILSFGLGVLSAQDLNVRTKSRGMPAYPFPQTVKQVDGTQITLLGRGDAVYSWYETVDGYTVLKDSDGAYVYAKIDESGNMIPSKSLVSSDDDNTGIPYEKGLQFSEIQKSIFKAQYFSGDAAKSNPTPFPSKGNNNVLVILAEFPDQPATASRSLIENLMNQENYNGTGSLRDYYLEISYDSLVLNSTVADWITVSNNMSYYGANDEFGYDIAPQELVRETLDQLESNGFDFSPFDNDQDGYVDEIVVFHSGYGEQFTDAGDTCIWSHAYSLGDLSVTYDGVILDNYIIGPELYGNAGQEITSIGTMVHEFAHSLAIPDMYDVDQDGSGGYAWDLNFWDLMAVGSWNNEGITPAGINAWLKEYMGWMDIPVITASGTYTLNNVYQNQEAFRINSGTADEFFILENRQWYGFDVGIPGYGMLVYHVDLNYPGWLHGDVNVDPLHQGFDLLEADNIRDSLTIDGDSYPGWDSITELNSQTTPGLITWIGREVPIAISNIAQSDSVISFDLLNTEFDNAPAEWVLDTSLYSYVDTLIAIVKVGGIPIDEGYLTAYVGDEVRGRAGITYFADSTWFLFQLLTYSNSASGEDMSFKYYSVLNDSIYDLIDIVPFNTLSPGTMEMPLYFNAPVNFVKDFISGWNWFSMNVELDDMSPGNVMGSCATAGDYIKSQTQSSTNYGIYGWFGTLSAMNTSDLYLLRVANSCGINVDGIPVNPSAQQINIVPGWNWVAYSPQFALSTASALGSLNPSNLDYVKNQTQSTTYYDGWGWFGTLTSFQPGQGYMMDFTNADQLVYPSSAPAKKSLSSIEHPEFTDTFNPHSFEFNGTLTISLENNSESVGSPGDKLLAYVNGQCRGQVEGLNFPASGKLVFPLMVYSNIESGEELTFMYYSVEEDEFYSVGGIIEFQKNIIQGDALSPIIFNLNKIVENVDITELNWDLMTAYPNPFRQELIVEIKLPYQSEYRLELLDVSGRLLDIIDQGKKDKGDFKLSWSPDFLDDGTYLLRLLTPTSTIVKRITHLN